MTNTTNTANNGGGLGLASILGVAFIVLKLIGVITWPWLWVLAPFWIPFGLVLVLLLVGAVLVGIGTAIETKNKN